ncbi:murein hydrolase activator EnvC family protein [Bailinhaonella thermotolerans]|uniref:M23 family metallopeptidase n=1 Tax=Bailinhaonella thermotolerans TaxID=1070861 RepID=A0A3A4A122_9ACTN|nr:M23 family metallopeptidase [Bailinhaonella thermotolerans]RJL21754.1 M23 family metallopeptidase [Bailinhaonella thermotolerans]
MPPRFLPHLAALAAAALALVLPSAAVAAPPRPSPGAAPRPEAPGASIRAPDRTPDGLGRGAVRWRWPLDGPPRVGRPFAPPPLPWLPGHRGVDLPAAPGTRVLAPGPGRVAYAGPLAGRGIVVLLHPGGLRTTYLPLTPSVSPGDEVRAGQELGLLAPGTHCPGPCLHWGLLHGPTYLNPLLLLGLGQVRLLPLHLADPTPTSTRPPPGLDPVVPHATRAGHPTAAGPRRPTAPGPPGLTTSGP